MYNFIIGMMLLFILLPGMGFPVTYFVKPNGDDNAAGTSWETAFQTITKATDVATSGSQVWVKHGTYKEGDTIEIDKGVSYYGGFEGTETDLEQRDITGFPTIIDGEELYQCVENSGTIDGFHVTNGKTGSYAGGINNLGGTVNNCFIYSNSAYSSGGINNDGGIVSNCSIYSNSASIDTGGITNLYEGILTNCSIYSNSADYGGGIYNMQESSITNCISWKNINGDIVGESNDIKFSCFGEAEEEKGNMRCNPLFVNTTGDPSTWDLRLQNGSPCIDSGTLQDIPESDIEGNPRPGGDGKVCMGAYESPDEYMPFDPAPPTRIYISKNGNNSNGDSWENAYNNIIETISLIDGDDLYEIWVGEGGYSEGMAICVPGRVNLYGGFAGTETSIQERSIHQHGTFIYGEDSYRCVYNYGMIDGFYVNHGVPVDDIVNGGGIFNDRGKINNCIIHFNLGAYGGGIYNFFGTVSNCSIYSNSASEEGGGIYNHYGKVSNSSIFSNSNPLRGGGIRNDSGIIENCAIYSNQVQKIGGGIFNEQGSVNVCSVYSNSATEGGGIFNGEGTVRGCEVHSNYAHSSGGGIWTYMGTISNCSIFNNTSRYGGGISNDSGIIFNCIIHSNSADSNGGGITNNHNVINCTLYSNSALWEGGGIWGSGKAINCIFWNN